MSCEIRSPSLSELGKLGGSRTRDWRQKGKQNLHVTQGRREGERLTLSLLEMTWFQLRVTSSLCPRSPTYKPKFP